MIEGIMLCRFSLDLNSNKFYEIRLMDSNNVQCRYGRVGQEGLIKEYTGGKRKYESLIRAKTADKKGYKKVDLELISNAKGQVALSSDHKKTNLMDAALKQIKYFDQESRDLIEKLSKKNIHNIISATDIQYDEDDGLFKTPLGIITEKSLQRAFQVLSEIDTILNKYNYDQLLLPKTELELLNELNAEYFILIPTKIKDTTDKDYLLYSKNNIEHQEKICDMLFDTISMLDELKERHKKKIEEMSKDSTEQSLFDVSLKLLTDAGQIKKIEHYFETSKNKVHSSVLNRAKIVKIFEINLGAQQEPFKTKSSEIGNIHSLWHGTKIANILSIMSKGLLMPRMSPGSKAGAMFGEGLYFANQSTKSAQYCDGMRYSGSSRSDKMYMFIADVAMGKSYTPKSSTGSSGRPPKGYDSFWAKSGISGVVNDEMIIFNGDQVRLTHLIEIESF